MMQQISSVHRVDDAGNPAGGRTAAIGIDITWQDGPLGRDCDRDTDGDGNCPIHPGGCPTRQVPNGAFVEGVIEAAIDRIRFYQEAAGGKFKCRENALAITDLESAQNWLNRRTAEREARQVEGTHES